MAAPLKNGLSYFPLDVEIFDEDKIALVSEEFGIMAELVVVKLLCRIYKDHGYYILWNEDIARLMAKRDFSCSVKGSFINSVVRALVKRGFFDKKLFDSFHILTSKGIQNRYIYAKRLSKAPQLIDSQYNLIPKEKTEKRKSKKVVNANNPIINVNNSLKESKGKESKIKESKIKESKIKESKIKESKIKDSKIKDSKIKDSKIKDSKIKDSKIKDSKIKDSKVKESKVKESINDNEINDINSSSGEEESPFLSETDVRGIAPEMNFSSDKIIRNPRPNTDYQSILNSYNQICGTKLPQVNVLSAQRKKQIKTREPILHQLGKTWEDFFLQVAGSNFLIGDNNHGFQASFDWIIKPSNFAKIMNGNYDNRTPRKKSNDGPIEVDYNKKYTLEEAFRKY